MVEVTRPIEVPKELVREMHGEDGVLYRASLFKLRFDDRMNLHAAVSLQRITLVLQTSRPSRTKRFWNELVGKGERNQPTVRRVEHKDWQVGSERNPYTGGYPDTELISHWSGAHDFHRRMVVSGAVMAGLIPTRVLLDELFGPIEQQALELYHQVLGIAGLERKELGADIQSA